MAGLYQLEAVIGVGSFATVCVARRNSDGARVALKVLRADLVNDASLLARMHDESRVLSTLDLPGIVRVYALHDYAGRRVLEMEAVDGMSLGALLRQTRKVVPPVQALEIVRQVANALHGAYHAASGPRGEPLRVVHRDVKPDNLLIAGDTGAIKLVDFGLAKADLAERAARTVGILSGSAGFEAPEQRVGIASPASDVYALGVTLFTLVADRTLMLARDDDKRAAELDRQLAMVFAELPEAAATRSRRLVASMVDSEPKGRPTASAVSAEISAIFAESGLAPNLVAWARTLPPPRTRVPARDHPAWEDLAFLETEDPTIAPRRSLAEARTELERLLALPGWPRRLPEIERALLSSPERAEAPLLAILSRASVPWWRFWAHPAGPDELEAALWVLAARPSNDVLRLARSLANHPVLGVSRCARLVLERAGAG
jgi:serine/threonine-protein kinase